MSSPFAVLARSLLFNALFYVNMIVRMIVALPTIVLPHAFLLGILRGYARQQPLASARDLRRQGRMARTRKAVARRYLVACKHQSLWETFALFALLPDPAYIISVN